MTMPTPREEQHIEMVSKGIESTSRLLGLDAPTYGGTPVLTEELANASLKVAVDLIGDFAKLYPPGHEGNYWCVWGEGYPDEWAVRASLRDDIEWPAGVWVEAVNGWCLALHVKS